MSVVLVFSSEKYPFTPDLLILVLSVVFSVKYLICYEISRVYHYESIKGFFSLINHFLGGYGEGS